jgi:hypothetical protein
MSTAPIPAPLEGWECSDKDGLLVVARGRLGVCNVEGCSSTGLSTISNFTGNPTHLGKLYIDEGIRSDNLKFSPVDR